MLRLNILFCLHCTHLIIANFLQAFSILWPCRYAWFVCMYTFLFFIISPFAVCSLWLCAAIFLFRCRLSRTDPVSRSRSCPNILVTLQKPDFSIQCERKMLNIDWLGQCAYCVYQGTHLCLYFFSFRLVSSHKIVCWTVLFARKKHPKLSNDFEKAVYVLLLFPHLSIYGVAIADNGLCILPCTLLPR